MLNFTNLEIRRGKQLLLDGCTFTVHRSNRLGITGANGCGKSTLFSLILGEIGADAGDFDMPRKLVIAHVAQETPASQTTALDYVIDGDPELRQLQKQLEQAESGEDGERLAHLLAELERVGGYTAEARAATLLNGLGFTTAQTRQPVAQFSGGWRMRLNLAQTLMSRSDLLLLDEPTNHLDLDAVIWLENWLRQYQGTLLLISHDREFLDNVCTHIGHIEHRKLKLYTGNYAYFEQARAQQLSTQQSAYEKQQREIAHVTSYVTRFRAKATKARQAQSRLKALARLEVIAPAHVDSPFKFSFRTPDKLPDPLLRMRQASIGYGDTPILEKVKLEIHRDARIGLLGPNGAGKSTLIKALADELSASEGEIHIAKETRIAYFAQHQLEQLNLTDSALGHLRKLDERAGEADLRSFLGGFGFQSERVFDPVEPFSGGEKARLVLAMLVYQRPNLLLLDEPSNHLDIQMRHALSLALQDFAGAIVLISHDRHLLKTTCDQLLLVDNGRVGEFDEDIDAYPKWLQQRARSGSSQPGSQSASGKLAGGKSGGGQSGGGQSAGGPSTGARPANRTEKAESAKARKQREADARKQLAPLRNQVNSLEKQLDRLNRKKTELEEKLADEALYQDSARETLKTLLWDQAELSKAIDQTEEEWMTQAEALEKAHRAI